MRRPGNASDHRRMRPGRPRLPALRQGTGRKCTEYGALRSPGTPASRCTLPAAAPPPGWRWVSSPSVLNLSPSRPDEEPAASVCAARLRVGSARTNSPDASISSRVKVDLSITTATLGGSKSRGIVHAAAITLRRPAWAEDTSTVGPWLRRRQALERGTGWRVMGRDGKPVVRPTSLPPRRLLT